MQILTRVGGYLEYFERVFLYVLNLVMLLLQRTNVFSEICFRVLGYGTVNLEIPTYSRRHLNTSLRRWII